MRPLATHERLRSGTRARVLQMLALYAPGAGSTRVWLHRKRGVDIGDRVFIGTDALIETSRPELVSIGNGVQLGIRTVIIAHARFNLDEDHGEGHGKVSVRLEDHVSIGPGVIILPNVTVGYGAVVAAGSVVTRSVPPLTLVQGNPARPVARSRIPLAMDTSIRAYYRQLRPL